ncbi:MAG: rhomboid family intramembrane serine protease [Acidimicrobiia bacterium]|nr:rhomboid family intramembrane serine protease [Acidimicrobiia bacterium]
MDTAIQTCYRHPDRRAGVICQRCDRPICPDCMHQASVGFHCPECTKQGAQKVISARSLRPPRPVATFMLIGMNVMVYLVGIGSGGTTKGAFIRNGGLVSGGEGLSAFGVANGEWYRLVSSGFLHADFLHLAFNMFVLYRLGQLLEPVVGRGRFVLLYFVAMLGGALGVMIIDPSSFTVGASGAVFGLMGVAVAVFRARGISIMDSGLGATIMLNLVFTFAVPNISVGGHVGGLIVGFLAGWVLTDFGPRVLKDPTVIVGAVVAIGLVAGSASIVLAGAG